MLRYRNEEGLNADGLIGEEGTFVICSFWLVSAWRKAGEVERARGAVRPARRLRQRPRPAGRGDRHRHRRAARQLPAGVQPHRPDHRRVGDRPGASRAVVMTAVVVEVDAHEGPVYVPDEDALYFTSVPAPGVAIKRLVARRRARSPCCASTPTPPTAWRCIPTAGCSCASRARTRRRRASASSTAPPARPRPWSTAGAGCH